MPMSVININFSTPRQRSSTLPLTPPSSTSSLSTKKFLPSIKGLTPPFKSRTPSSFPLSNLYVSLSLSTDRLLNKTGKKFSIKKDHTSPLGSINRLTTTPTLVRRSPARNLFTNAQDVPISSTKGSPMPARVTSPLRTLSDIETMHQSTEKSPTQCLFFTISSAATTEPLISKSNNAVMTNQSFSLSKFKNVLLKRKSSSIILFDHSFKVATSLSTMKQRLKHLLVKRQELKHSIDNLCRLKTRKKHVSHNRGTFGIEIRPSSPPPPPSPSPVLQTPIACNILRLAFNLEFEKIDLLHDTYIYSSYSIYNYFSYNHLLSFSDILISTSSSMTLNAIMFTTTSDIYLFQPKFFYNNGDSEQERITQNYKFTYLTLDNEQVILTAESERINSKNQFQIGFCFQAHTTVQIQTTWIHYLVSYNNVTKNVKNSK
ncbi:unnamed protein product, partial [Didymodactylos carnosus]